ncbi:hypothetical protein IW262DRAFT_1301249 [Armillaria fumosa]|nr:hypothetical protein IW262DRAFT_1301249 [Armillaria fumosa]
MSTFSSLARRRHPRFLHRTWASRDAQSTELSVLRYTAEPTPFIPSERWPSSTPVPTTGRHLELQLLNKVAEGRIGLVHFVQVLGETSGLSELLRDDVYDYCFEPDDGKASSLWDKWKHAPDQLLVAVLVMEKLGEPYYQDCPGDDLPYEREDLRNVMRFNNVLRVVNPGLFGPRYSCYHRWRFINFDKSRCSVFADEAEEDREFAESRIEEVGASHFGIGFGTIRVEL